MLSEGGIDIHVGKRVSMGKWGQKLELGVSCLLGRSRGVVTKLTSRPIDSI